MNKETRQFIWGLVLLLVCGIGVSIHLNNIANGTWPGGINYLYSFLFSIVGCIAGFYYVIKNTL